MFRFRFSLSALLIAVTVAGGLMLYVRARYFTAIPYSSRVSGTIGDLPPTAFCDALAKSIEELGYEPSEGSEGLELATFRNVHNGYEGRPRIYRGAFSNGKVFYIHCYFRASPVQEGMTEYSIAVSFFETPYERWYTKQSNQSHARATALDLYDLARSLWAEQWHAQQRKKKGLPTED